MHATLCAIPLFRSLPKPERAQLAEAAEPLRFEKGQTLFTEGQPADFVWIVTRGWVSLIKRGTHGAPVTLFVVTPAEGVCGISAIEQGAYAASAIASAEAHVLRIPAVAFQALLLRCPMFAKQMILLCASRMRRMAETISLAHASAEQRIAYTLLRLRAALGSTVPITHHELARMAGTRWETSIRTVSTMKRRGLVSSARGRMTILHADRLRACLHGAFRNGHAKPSA